MSTGSRSPVAHVGSRDFDEAEPFDGDPRIAPGLPRPVGWRVRTPDGTAAYDKVGPLDTDWVPVGESTSAAISAGDAGIVVTNPTPTSAVISQVIAAEWPKANIRVYAIDAVNGSDANAGFADAAGTTAADYQAACAAAGLVAKATFAGLAAIFPRVGNGRLVEILIANGGVNTPATYAGGLDLILNGSVGWGSACPVVRGTGTNTTAGSVAFAGTNAEIDYSGGVTVTGLNAAGYNPTGAPTTSVIQMLKVGGAAPALPAEPAAPLGWRIRFDIATATAALRGICRQISAVTGGDTILPQTVLPAVPGPTDVFYIEQAGVVCGAFTVGGFGWGTPQTAAQLCGIRSTGAVLLGDSHTRLIFCGANSFSYVVFNLGLTTQTIVHPVAGNRVVGGGLRSETTIGANLASGQLGTLAGMVSAQGTTLAFATQLNWGAGSFARGLTIQNCQLPVGTDVATAVNIGIAGTAVGIPRIDGALRLTAAYAQIGAVAITGAGANPAIRITAQCVVCFGQAVATGVTGNNDVGLDLVNSRGSLIILAVTPTVSGALGDIRLAGGQIITWAQAIATGVVDSAGNRIIGTAGVPPMVGSPFGGTLTGAAGAVFSYYANAVPGAANNAVALRRPTSQRLALRMRVTSIANTSANITTVTLYKNGVPTTMVCAIPAGAPAGTKIVDSAHPILFADGDDFDLRHDDAADPGGVVDVSGQLEWAA